MKKDIFYFPHYCHARSDRRMRRILKDFKHEGYSVYYQLLEILREQEEFKYPLEDCDLLVDDLKTTDIVVNSLIMNYDLFQNDGVFFWSDDLIEALQPYLKMKQQRKDAAQKSVEARKKKKQKLLTTVERPLNESQTPVEQSKVKESKVKESKVNKTKEKEIREYSFFSFVLLKNGETLKIDKQVYLEKFPRNAEAMKMRYPEIKDDQSFNNTKHLHNSFNYFLGKNGNKRKDNGLEAKREESKFTVENPNPIWFDLAIQFKDVPQSEQEEYTKWYFSGGKQLKKEGAGNTSLMN